MILNPYNFVPLAANVNIEIYYSNELENKCIQDISIGPLNYAFTIQEINFDKKDFAYDTKLKDPKADKDNEYIKN